ncbi:hypothetical protein U1Q18_014134, partial [Sarracenia purpurea var. burkii]
RHFRKIRDLEITVDAGKGDSEKKKEELSNGCEWLTVGGRINLFSRNHREDFDEEEGAQERKNRIGFR